MPDPYLDFQRNRAVELRVAREINLTHPARAKLTLNFVATQSCTGGQGHKQNLQSDARVGVRQHLGECVFYLCNTNER